MKKTSTNGGFPGGTCSENSWLSCSRHTCFCRSRRKTETGQCQRAECDHRTRDQPPLKNPIRIFVRHSQRRDRSHAPGDTQPATTPHRRSARHPVRRSTRAHRIPRPKRHPHQPQDRTARLDARFGPGCRRTAAADHRRERRGPRNHHRSQHRHRRPILHRSGPEPAAAHLLHRLRNAGGQHSGLADNA